jgi:hypothetical protein
VVGVLMAALGSPLLAQSGTAWFGGVAFGGVHLDRHGNDFLRQNGLFLRAHGGREVSRVLAIRLDLLHSSVHHNDDLVFVPCGPPPDQCPVPFLGPTRAFAVAAGLEARWRDRHIQLTATMGPSANWLTSRPPGARKFSPGFRWAAEGGYEILRNVFVTTGLEYHRLFTDDGSLRWLLPLVVGLDIRARPKDQAEWRREAGERPGSLNRLTGNQHGQTTRDFFHPVARVVVYCESALHHSTREDRSRDGEGPAGQRDERRCDRGLKTATPTIGK